jgi:peptidyl-prolyl cis-trans isomerase B (cyclophilin B)
MAHAGKNTGGSQFFICHTPQRHLDGVHTVFGQVTKGMDVVNAIKDNDEITSIRVS